MQVRGGPSVLDWSVERELIEGLVAVDARIAASDTTSMAVLLDVLVRSHTDNGVFEFEATDER